MVNMWCAGSHFFSSAFHSNRGKSMIQQNRKSSAFEGQAGGPALGADQQHQVAGRSAEGLRDVGGLPGVELRDPSLEPCLRDLHRGEARGAVHLRGLLQLSDALPRELPAAGYHQRLHRAARGHGLLERVEAAARHERGEIL
jgi:hypothetical protein